MPTRVCLSVKMFVREPFYLLPKHGNAQRDLKEENHASLKNAEHVSVFPSVGFLRLFFNNHTAQVLFCPDFELPRT